MKAVIFSEPNKVKITDVDEPCVGQQGHGSKLWGS